MVRSVTQRTWAAQRVKPVVGLGRGGRRQGPVDLGIERLQALHGDPAVLRGEVLALGVLAHGHGEQPQPRGRGVEIARRFDAGQDGAPAQPLGRGQAAPAGDQRIEPPEGRGGRPLHHHDGMQQPFGAGQTPGQGVQGGIRGRVPALPHLVGGIAINVL